MSTIHLKIVTPERTVVEQEVYQVTLPVVGGDVTILPSHMPYIGSLSAGEVLVRREMDGEEELLATSGGFVEFHGDTLVVLADTAERADEIDLARAEEAKKRAETLKNEAVQMSEEEYAGVAAMIERETARVRVARKHHSKRSLSMNNANEV